jgi:O-antigen ligase
MQFLIILIALAASVWLIPLVRSQRAIALPTLVLVVGVVLGPAFFAIDGPIQISLDRVLWVAMLAYVAINIRLGNFRLPKVTRTDCVVAAVTMWLFLSCMRGGDEMPDGSSPLARWLFYVALPTGMYYTCRIVPIGPSDIRWFSRVILGLGVYLAFTAVFEIKGVHELAFPRHIVDPEIWEFFGRGRGPLLNPPGNGILITISLVLAAIEFFQAQGRTKAVFAFLSLVLLVGVYATLTRSAWMGAIAALAIVSLVYTPRWVRVLGLVAAVMLVGAFALGLKDQIMQIKRDKHLSAADAEKSVQLRPLLAIVGWEMIKDRPMIGHGFGHYHEFAGPYHENRTYDMPLEQARPYMQHNVILSLAVDSGLIGVALMSSCLFVWLSAAWQLARSAANQWHLQIVGLTMLGSVVAYFVNGMFQDVSIIPMINMMLLAWTGMTVNLSAQSHYELKSPIALRTARHVPAGSLST